MLRRPMAALSALVLAVIILSAVFASMISPLDPQLLKPEDRLLLPSRTHILGSDQYGRDVFSRLVYGARISLVAGLGTTFVAMSLGLGIGLVSGYYRATDAFLMRIMDALMAFPGIVLAIGIMGAIGPSVWNVAVSLGLVYMPRASRVVRSTVLIVAGMEYVQAVQALGARDGRIMRRHVLPNCVSPIIVQASFVVAYGILGEATLSFLGIGSPPYIPSWGGMLSEARLFMQQAPWLSIFPGLAIVMTVLAVNILGDTLRDAYDPRARIL
jgi:peptide/nickel transport system permease protein